MGEFEKRLETLQSMKTESIQSLLFDNDDRATAIMATGLLEDMLAIGIVQKFQRIPSGSQATELFTGYGPLATLSAKTSLAYLLGVIGPDVRHDLQIIRRVRNDFAHVIAPLTFETPDIAKRCRSLKLKLKLVAKFERRAGDGPKGNFVRSTMRIFAHIIMNVHLSIEQRTFLMENQARWLERAKARFAEAHKVAMEKPPPSS